jgi:hypothetical protein
MRLILGLAVMLSSFSAAAVEVQLVCQGSATVYDQNGGGYESVNLTNILSFDEETEKVSLVRNGKQEKVKNIEFTDREISGQIKGSLRTYGQPIDFRLDRYTGILSTDIKLGIDTTLQCQKLSEEKLF